MISRITTINNSGPLLACPAVNDGRTDGVSVLANGPAASLKQEANRLSLIAAKHCWTSQQWRPGVSDGRFRSPLRKWMSLGKL